MATMKTKLDLPKEDIQTLVHDSSDWNSTTIADLAKLLSDSLHTCIRDAIKKIVESGYSKEVAEYTILRCDPFYVIKDLASSIADHALNSLKTKGFHDANLHTFQDLNSLVEYMMMGIVTILREIKPSLSVREAIWRLLICDLNVLDASRMEIDPHKFSMGSTSTKAEPEPETKPELPSNPGKRIVDECTCFTKSCSLHKKTSILQKPYHVEKSYNKGRVSKIVLKAKLGKLSDLSSSFVNKKNPTFPVKETEEKAKDTTEPTKTADYYLAGIPYDESKGEHLPQNEKDEMILAAVGHLKSLQKELKGWDDWANDKVMQVAKRLSQDRTELIMLRKEKAEAEKIKKDKQVMEESMTKKLAEITAALSSSDCEDKMANSAIVRLETENSAIRLDRDIAEKQSIIEARRLEEDLSKEQENLKKAEIFMSEKNLLAEDLKSLKRETGPKERDLEKAKCLLKEAEIRLANERRKTAEFLKLAETLRNEREGLEALAKKENEKVSENAEKDFKKLETEIKRIQYEIAAMNLQSSGGISWSDVSGNTSRKKDRECVMCLNEEMSVVFVPCGHQVVCAKCNEIHEKNGMKDCPSCRTKIQKRIVARFAKS